MICRLWRGWTTPENAPRYEAIVRGHVIPAIEARGIPGFQSIDLMRRPLEDGVEFATLMWFDNLEAVKAFVGEDYEIAHVPDEAREVLSRFDERSAHFEVMDRRAQPSSGSSPIVELRQYTLHPNRRDVLIELFERALIEPQEDVGMKIIGQFIDRDDPDRFVWLRGFADMKSRREGLAAFYGGPVWQAHRDDANATMIDIDNVLLLRAARSGATFTLGEERPAVGADGSGRGIVSAAIVYLRSSAGERGAVDVFESTIAPAIAAAGGSLLGYFVTEASKNDFPSLPVRENEPVFLWFAGFAEEADSIGAVRAASAFSRARLSRRIEHLTLVPTPRSLLTGGTPSCSAAEALSEFVQTTLGDEEPNE